MKRMTRLSPILLGMALLAMSAVSNAPSVSGNRVVGSLVTLTGPSTLPNGSPTSVLYPLENGDVVESCVPFDGKVVPPPHRNPWVFKGINFRVQTTPYKADDIWSMWDNLILYPDVATWQIRSGLQAAKELGCEVVEVYLSFWRYWDIYSWDDISKASDSDSADYLNAVERFLELAESVGIQVMFTFFPQVSTISPSDGYTDKLLDCYLQNIVTRAKGHPALYAYGICNEFDMLYYNHASHAHYDATTEDDDTTCKGEIADFIDRMIRNLRTIDATTPVELEFKYSESLGWLSPDTLAMFRWVGISVWEQTYGCDPNTVVKNLEAELDKIPSYTDLPVMISEFGLSTHPTRGYSRKEQADYYRAYLEVASDRCIAVRPWMLLDLPFWSLYWDSLSGGAHYAEGARTGLVDPETGDKKAAWYVYRAWSPK